MSSDLFVGHTLPMYTEAREGLSNFVAAEIGVVMGCLGAALMGADRPWESLSVSARAWETLSVSARP